MVGVIFVGLVGLTAAVRPHLVSDSLSRGVAGLDRADAALLWLAGAAFLVSLVASACTWRTTLEACGARVDLRGTCARYGVGSVVNTFAPMRLGDATRVLLFSRTLPQEPGRALTAGGGLATIGLARALVQSALILVAALLGALPLWPVLVLAGIGSIGVLAVMLVRDRLPQRRLAHLLDAARALARSPARAVALLGWTSVAAVSRVIAAATIAASLGVPWSFGTGLIITAALDLAATVPLTPGSIGIASGAVTLALQARGVPLTTSIAAGLAFHAVETLAGLAFGVASLLQLVRYRSPAVRRWGLRAAAAAYVVIAVFGVSLSVFLDIV